MKSANQFSGKSKAIMFDYYIRKQCTVADVAKFFGCTHYSANRIIDQELYKHQQKSCQTIKK